MKRILVVVFGEVPSLTFESEAASEVAKAFEGWCEVDVFAAMPEASAHVESFHGGRLHRLSLGSASDSAAAAAAFERGLERQFESIAYDAIHLLTPVGARAVIARNGGTAPVVAQLQPIPTLAARWGPHDAAWLERLAAEEAATLDAAAVLILHDPADASAIRYRRRLAPHAVVPAPVDLDSYHWEQLAPADGPVVLVLDSGLGGPGDDPVGGGLEGLDRTTPVSVWRLSLATGRIRPAGAEQDLPLAEWASGRSDTPVRLRIAARMALDSADVVVAPVTSAFDSCGLAGSCRRWGVLESAACRRPLVVCDSPRFPVPADLAENVFRFPQGDWDAMGQVIRSVLLHPAKAVQVAERAAQRVAAVHAASDFRRRLRALYAGILGHDPTRPGPIPAHPAPSSGPATST